MDMRHLPKSLLKKLPGTPEYYDDKKDSMIKRNVTLANQHLQRVIQELNVSLKDNTDFEVLVSEVNRKIPQCSILKLAWVNNFESTNVLYLSLYFCYKSFLISEDKLFFLKHSPQIKHYIHILYQQNHPDVRIIEKLQIENQMR